LCPSGVEEFPHVNENDVKKALMELRHLNTVLAVNNSNNISYYSNNNNNIRTFIYINSNTLINGKII
jgi:hypothetical protein